MLLHSVQCSSHTNRAGEAGGPDPTKLNIHNHTHTHTHTGQLGTLLIYRCASLVWDGEKESVSERERDREGMLATEHGEVVFL